MTYQPPHTQAGPQQDQPSGGYLGDETQTGTSHTYRPPGHQWSGQWGAAVDNDEAERDKKIRARRRPHLPNARTWFGDVLARIRRYQARIATIINKNFTKIYTSAGDVPFLQALGRYFSTITFSGWLMIVGACISWWLALSYDWKEAWACAVVFAIVVIVAHIWLLHKEKLRLHLALSQRRVTVGDDIAGMLSIEQQGSSRISGLEVAIPVGSDLLRFVVPRLQPGAIHHESFSIPTQRRGLVNVGPVYSSRSDPLFVMERNRVWNQALRVYVHPRTVALDHSAVGFLRDIEGATTRVLSSSDVSFHALRDYIPGDERRSIHWKSTAKMGRLMVRQFEETRRAHLLLICSQNPQHYTCQDEFELTVSSLASIAVQAFKEGKTVSLVSDEGFAIHPTARQVLDYLTVINPIEKAKPLPELVADAVGHVSRASVVFLGVGALSTMNDLYHARSRMGVSMVPYVVRSVVGDPGADNLSAARRRDLSMPRGGHSHRVGAMTVLDVADLESLPAMLRKVSLT